MQTSKKALTEKTIRTKHKLLFGLNTTDNWQQTTWMPFFSNVRTTHAIFYVINFMVLNVGTSDIADLS
jgi:hypothetical protein